MSNYPENANIRAYERSITPQTQIETIWDAHAHMLNHTIGKMFHDWPLDSIDQTQRRRDILVRALDMASLAFEQFIDLSDKQRHQLNMNYAGAFSANSRGCKETVGEYVGDWMHVYAMAIEHQEKTRI